MRHIFLLALPALSLALTRNPALAQRVSFGPVVGIAVANWRGAGLQLPTQFRNGFMGGAFVALGIRKHFGVEAQVLYVRKGMEERATNCPFGGPCQDFTVTYKQDYLEVPVLLTVSAPMRFAPTIFAGPAVAFQISCVFTSTLPPPYRAPCDSVFSGAAGSPWMKHTDALLVFGGGVQLGQLGLVARYDLGLTKLLYRGTTEFDFKTRAWLIGAKYRLPR